MQTVRLLRWSDAWFCYKLAKDPDVRKVSLDSRVPTLLGHLRWMRSWIHGEGRIAWIIVKTGDTFAGWRVGLVRFDRSTCEVGIAITPKARGQGVALEALLSATPYFHREGGKVLAVIKRQNTASLGLFRKAGYRTSHIFAQHVLDAKPNITMEWRPE